MMDRAWVIERIAHNSNGDAERGDHDLNPNMRPTPPLRPAAVLVGLVERPKGLNVLLTQRTDTLEHHPGQISFPGGHTEAGDTNAVAAALRETQEEIGLASRHIDIVGRLNTYVTRTGVSITPVVALVRPPFTLKLNPAEVADAFEVPLAFFMTPANHARQMHEVEGMQRSYYAMTFENIYIWGATAGILMNLYQSLVDAPDAT